MSTRDALADELDEARNTADEIQKLVYPSQEEARNGWTARALTDYIAERAAGQELKIDPNSLHRRRAKRPRVQNSKYNPHRWRG
jgi:hypothetical protein